MNQNKKIMGILNITPDSFYDGGKFNLTNIESEVKKMIEQGVDIIDIGGFSSKPGSIMPSIEEELSRILPILDIVDKLNVQISVDTCRSEVVEKILKYKNLAYVNDISGLKDEKILDLIAGTNIGYILMHIQGAPETMQINPKYNNIISEINDFFKEKLKIVHLKGIKNIILDPGFGFGKSLEDNYKILNNLSEFKKYGYEILVGLSRKSMIYKFLNTTPKDVLSETVALNLYALQKGGDILRIHDVLENKNIIKLYKIIEENN